MLSFIIYAMCVRGNFIARDVKKTGLGTRFKGRLNDS